jgi:hypothetical protein
VEDKIVQLQQSKRDLADAIIANHALILHVVAGRGKWIPPSAKIITVAD